MEVKRAAGLARAVKEAQAAEAERAFPGAVAAALLLAELDRAAKELEVPTPAPGLGAANRAVLWGLEPVAEAGRVKAQEEQPREA